MICPSCKKEIPLSDMQCDHCGNKFRSVVSGNLDKVIIKELNYAHSDYSEIKEAGQSLKRSKENVEAELPKPPKGWNFKLTIGFALEAIGLVLEAIVFIAFVIVLIAAPPSILRSSSAKYLVLRAAVFAGILAFFHYGMRTCLTIMVKSHGWAQRIGLAAVALMVVVLTLGAFMILMFFSLGSY